MKMAAAELRLRDGRRLAYQEYGAAQGDAVMAPAQARPLVRRVIET
ncbi:MAG: hypothetical protein ACRDNP_14905 [Gaiellaceae bacterium]